MNKFMRMLALFAGAQLAAASGSLLTQWERECLRPVVTTRNMTDNYPANNLAFSFGSVAAVDPITGILTDFIANDQVLHLLESSVCECGDEDGRQKTLYIKFTPASSVPVFDAMLSHVLVITAKNPVVFRKLVDLYTIYLRTAQLPLPALPIVVVASPTTNSLVIEFPIGYDINGQTLVLDYTTVASASSVLVNATATGFDVTLRSEIFKPNYTYTGELGLDALADATTQRFENYDDYPERTFLSREELQHLIQDECKRPSAFTNSDLDEIRCYLKKCNICVRLSAKCVKVGRAGKCVKSKKAHLLRYFTFVSCCLNAFPGLKKKSVCERLQRACSGSDDAHGVFCAIVAVLARSSACVNFDLRVLIEMMFEVIIGYNPYCNLAKTSEAFYGLSEKDIKIVKGYSSEEEGAADSAEGSGEVEEAEKDEDERRRQDEKRRGGMFTRGRIIILVSVVVVVGGIAVYSLM